MSTDQNKAVILRWIEGLNTGNASALEALVDELYTVDFTGHINAQVGAVVGREGVKRNVRKALKSTPDVRLTVEDIFAEGDRVVSRLTTIGADSSTGKPVRNLVMNIWRLVGGQIVEGWQLVVSAETQP